MATDTTNYKLVKPADNETADIQVINGNMDIIDLELKDNSNKINVLSSDLDTLESNVTTHLADTLYQTAGGTATAITLTGVVLEDGHPKTFIASANNNGSATTINTKPLYKPGGTVAPTLIAGKAYTVWYNVAGGCFFIKASAEGTATKAQVLAGVPFSNETDTGLIGTLDLSLLTADNLRKDVTINGVTGNKLEFGAGDKLEIDRISKSVFEKIASATLPRTANPLLDYYMAVNGDIYLLYFISTLGTYYVNVFNKAGTLLQDIQLVATGLGTESKICAYATGFYVSYNGGYRQYDLMGNLTRTVTVSFYLSPIACLDDGTVFVFGQTGDSTDGYQYPCYKYSVDGVLLQTLAGVYGDRSSAMNGMKLYISNDRSRIAVFAYSQSSARYGYTYKMGDPQLYNISGVNYITGRGIYFDENDNIYVFASATVYVYNSARTLLYSVPVNLTAYPYLHILFAVDNYGGLYHGGTSSNILYKTVSDAKAYIVPENAQYDLADGVSMVVMNKGLFIGMSDTKLSIVRQYHTISN